MTYAQHIVAPTPQQEQAHDGQVKNNAGGYVFKLDPWEALERWLILGCEGGSYYATERKMTRDNAKTVQACLKLDGPKTVEVIGTVSTEGRAAKNSPAIFALALAAVSEDVETRKVAREILPLVCRIGTHLFEFLTAYKMLGGGGGRGMRRAVQAWYLERKSDNLAYQVLKYKQRGGMSHRDVLRLYGADIGKVPKYKNQDAVLRYIVCGNAFGERTVKRKNRIPHTYSAIPLDQVPRQILAVETLRALSINDVVAATSLIAENSLTREMVPTEFLKHPEVWEALLVHMPLGALLRNLGKLSNVGVIGLTKSAGAKMVAEKLRNVEALRKAKVHPFQALLAYDTYQAGKGVKGKLTWTPNAQVIEALDDCFSLAFQTIEPTGKARLVALDVSGSMSQTINNTTLQCRVAAAAMAMTTIRTESDFHTVAFTGGGYFGRYHGTADAITTLNFTKRMSLAQVVKETHGLPFGSTDCAQPLLWAMKNNIDVDAVEIYTDNETWEGDIHVHEALDRYRQKVGHSVKLIPVGMTATDYSVADPDDKDSLNIVGFDSAAPKMMADFLRK